MLTRPITLLLSALTVGGGVAGCASLDEWQRQAIFNPQNGSQRWFSDPLPGTEQYDVALANGHSLHFWYVPQQDTQGAPTVLYLHGARWNLNGSVFRLSRWCARCSRGAEAAAAGPKAPLHLRSQPGWRTRNRSGCRRVKKAGQRG
jgi:hypothetical protein